MMKRRNESTGDDLLIEQIMLFDSFDMAKADLAARSSERADVVKARLAALEAEQATLERVQRRLS